MAYALALVIFSIVICTVHLRIDAVKVSNYIKDFQTTSNPDTYLTPPKIIRRHGYPAEAHIIQSEDGYLLEYHRIPFGKTGPKLEMMYPILLHHGLLCSSIDWIINGPEKSLAYQLADDGYDVWMANARGNTYSRSHVSLTPKQKEFWNYSFHEMGFYDLPAAVDYILNVTGSKKLIYIGHSLGTTTFYVFSTTRPEYNNKIFFQISIAPVAMLPHTTSAFRHLVPYAKEIHAFSNWYNKGAFLEHDLMTQIFLKVFCGEAIFNFNICEQLVIFKLFGKDAEQFNQSLVPVIMSHMPAGTSSKNMIHCAQLISSGKFSYYDYGLIENIKKYHSTEPPAYDFSKISVPVQFYYGNNDILADPTDVNLLYQKIPKPMGLVSIKYEKWNHVDFLWGIDVNPLFNKELRQFIKNATEFPNFILSRVKSAVTERYKNPVPADEPLNEENFITNDFNGISSMGNITKIIEEYSNSNTIFEDLSFGDNPENKTNEILQQINNVGKDFNESVKRTGRNIRLGIQNTANKLVKVTDATLSAAKNKVEATVDKLNQKMKETLKNIENMFV